MFKVSRDPKFRRALSIQWKDGGPVLEMQVVFRRLPLDALLEMISAHDESLKKSSEGPTAAADHVRLKASQLRAVIVGVEGSEEADVSSDDVVDFLLTDLSMVHAMYREYLSSMNGIQTKNFETPPAALPA